MKSNIKRAVITPFAGSCRCGYRCVVPPTTSGTDFRQVLPTSPTIGGPTPATSTVALGCRSRRWHPRLTEGLSRATSVVGGSGTAGRETKSAVFFSPLPHCVVMKGNTNTVSFPFFRALSHVYCEVKHRHGTKKHMKANMFRLNVSLTTLAIKTTALLV